MRLLLMADSLTTFMCRLSGNLGFSKSWNLPGPVIGPYVDRFTFITWLLKFLFVVEKINP